MLHIHVLPAVPLGTSYMAEPGADQHEGRVAIGESAHHPGAAAQLLEEADPTGLILFTCLQRRLKPHDIRPHLLQSSPESQHFQTRRPCLFLFPFQFAQFIVPYRLTAVYCISVRLVRGQNEVSPVGNTSQVFDFFRFCFGC